MKLRVRLILTTLAAAALVFGTIGLLHFLFWQRANNEVGLQFALTYMENGGRAACEAAPERFALEGPEAGPPSAAFRPDGPPRPDGGGDGFPWPRLLHKRLFAYDQTLVSKNPESPTPNPELAKEFRSGVAFVGRRFMDHGPPERREHRPPPEHSPTPAWQDGKRPPRPPGLPEGFGPPERPRHEMQELLIRMPWNSGPCSVVLLRYEARSGDYGGFWPGDEPFPLPIGFFLAPVVLMLVIVLVSVGPLVRRIGLLTREVRASAGDRYHSHITLKGRDEIGQLARAFEEARTEIRGHIEEQQEREQNLRRFLENTTHDMSIPFTVLQGRLSDIARQLKETEHIDPQAFGAILSETHYLAALIYNLSVASKLETGQPALQREPVNLNEAVLRCAGRHRPIARQRNVSLDHSVPETPIFTLGDVTFIEQSVNNVLYNAIRYNHDGGHVAAILEAIDATHFKLRVIDDGPGIPDEELSRLTERYYRGAEGAERGRDTDGQGLGLNIAYQLANMHGWEFALRRSDYQGLEVEFAGPLCENPMEEREG